MSAEKKLVSAEVGRYDNNDVMQIIHNEYYDECVRTKKVGDLICSFAGAPGTGRFIEQITRFADDGIYGIEIENTIRELDPSEVY